MGSATKICPACHAAAQLYASACDTCGRHYPPQALPEEDTAPEAPAAPGPYAGVACFLGRHVQLEICLLGGILGIAGVFMPLLSSEVGIRSITFMQMHTGAGLIGVALIAMVLALFRQFTSVAYIGLGTLTYLSIYLFPLWRLLRARMESGVAGTRLLHLRYGWLVLILSGVLMIVGGAYDMMQRPSDPEERIVLSRKRKRFLLSCVAGVGTTLLLLMLLAARRRVLRSPRIAGPTALLSSASQRAFTLDKV
jgi:hypothetical protein